MKKRAAEASCAALANIARQQGAAVISDTAAELEAIRGEPASRRLRYDKDPKAKEARMTKTTSPQTTTNLARRATTRPRRHSRFGLLWLATFLTIAAWVGFGPRATAPSAESVPATACADVLPPASTVEPRTKRIADVVVGDRVKAENPTGEEDLSLGAEVDPASWRKLVLRASKTDGSWADVELLRPLRWIEECGARVGGRAPISVPECGIDGDADVLAIEPCPPIMPGKGRVVTGTFHHSSAHVLDLEIDGLAAPILTTVNHLFWSADRGRFVRADELRFGERLRGRKRLLGVRRATPRYEKVPVYNLEVHIDHVYHVSTAGILVHNGTPNPCGVPVPDGEWVKVARRDGPSLELQERFAERSATPANGLLYIEEYKLGGVYFDRFQNGVLGEVKGNYGFINKIRPDSLDEFRKGVFDEATRQLAVAKRYGVPLEWWVRAEDLPLWHELLKKEFPDIILKPY